MVSSEPDHVAVITEPWTHKVYLSCTKAKRTLPLQIRVPRRCTSGVGFTSRTIKCDGLNGFYGVAK